MRPILTAFAALCTLAGLFAAPAHADRYLPVYVMAINIGNADVTVIVDDKACDLKANQWCYLPMHPNVRNVVFSTYNDGDADEFGYISHFMSNAMSNYKETYPTFLIQCATVGYSLEMTESCSQYDNARGRGGYEVEVRDRTSSDPVFRIDGGGGQYGY